MSRLLRDERAGVAKAVRDAYCTHTHGQTVIPFSTFLRLPTSDPRRIIALPAYLGDDDPIAGVKWVSSVAGNVQARRARGSAIIILNSVDTGYPLAILEAATINAMRTGASAAIAARALRPACETLGIVGCGPINLETVAFFAALDRRPDRVRLCDLRADRADGFARLAAAILPEADIAVASLQTILAKSDVTSFATTATRPYVDDIASINPGALVLHLSLRDLGVGVILGSLNVVDDREHVLREQTSLELAAHAVGNTAFVRSTLGELLTTDDQLEPATDEPTIFSPFGLGILDLAVARVAYRVALREETGTWLPSFAATSLETMTAELDHSRL